MSYDPLDLKRQEQERRDHDTRQRIARQNEAADIRWLMDSERGRRLMWGWLTFCGLYRTPFDASTAQQSFNCGMHNVALMLNASVMEHCPDLALQMQTEASKALKDAAEAADVRI
jgi:hypothetical protein